MLCWIKSRGCAGAGGSCVLFWSQALRELRAQSCHGCFSWSAKFCFWSVVILHILGSVFLEVRLCQDMELRDPGPCEGT